jgi:peptidoglycan/LPS O-acetylase OafA/YrhL
MFIAVPGVLLFVFSSIFFVLSFSDSMINFHPVLAILLIAAGLLMTLYGTDRWGQWRNLYTIALIPAVFFMLYASSDDFGPLVAAVFAIPLLVYISRHVGRKRAGPEAP